MQTGKAGSISLACELHLAAGKASSCRSDLIRNNPRSALRGVFVARPNKEEGQLPVSDHRRLSSRDRDHWQYSMGSGVDTRCDSSFLSILGRPG
jgi:hypothetical protein